MTQLHILQSTKSDTPVTVVGGDIIKLSDGSHASIWPHHLDLPYDQVLIEPKSECATWAIQITNLKDSNQSPETIWVKPDESTLDALSDAVMKHRPEAFDAMTEDDVELMYENGSYQDDSILICAERKDRVQYAINSVRSNSSKVRINESLVIPLYTTEQIAKFNDAGLLEGFEAKSLGVFLKEQEQNIDNVFFHLSASPASLDSNAKEELSLAHINYQAGILSEKQRRSRIADILTQKMKRPPTSHDIYLAENEPARFRYPERVGDAPHLFLQTAKDAGVDGSPIIAQMIIDHLRANKTALGYENIVLAHDALLRKSLSPTNASLALSGYILHYLTYQAETDAVHAFIDHLKQRTDYSGSAKLDDLANMAMKTPRVFAKQHDITLQALAEIKTIAPDNNRELLFAACLDFMQKVDNIQLRASLANCAKLERKERHDPAVDASLNYRQR